MNKKTLKLISLILALIALLTSLPLQLFAIEDDTAVRIYHEGERVTALDLYLDSKLTLKAETELDGEPSYQWQVLSTGKEPAWVNISDKTEQTLAVTYALVSSMLDKMGQMQLRCTVTAGTDAYESDAVTVTAHNTNTPTTLPSYLSSGNNEPSVSVGQSTPNSDVKDVYSITINYIYNDGNMAERSYNLSIKAGDPVNYTIPNPTIVGYAPTLQVSHPGITFVTSESGSSIQIEYASLDAPQVVNVVYMPSLTKFTVNHHKQNLLDDNYTHDTSLVEVKYGYTGEAVPDCHLELEGFHSLYYDRTAIAADGTTVINVYYDRDYYLVSFDLVGGFGLEPIYTRYGTEISITAPSRPGYQFAAWTLISVGGRAPTSSDVEEYLFTATKQTVTVKTSLSYLALWTLGTTSYTMVFWAENAEDDAYSYWGSLTVNTDEHDNRLMTGSSASAQDWISRVSTIDDEQFFTFNPARSDKNVTVTGDGSTVVNAYYTRNRYTITFIANGKCALEAQHTHGEDCYVDICGQEHIHTADCVYHLVCDIPEHTEHTWDCIVCGKEEHVHGVHCDGVIGCGKEEHTHSVACCQLPEHTHVKNCYNSVGSRVTRPATSGSPNYHTFPSVSTNGYVARFVNSRNNKVYHYIYIAGSWYNYNSTAANGTVVGTKCGYVEHEHGSDITECLHCEKEAHVHDESCVSCTIEEHVHGDACYKDQIHVHDAKNCYEYPNCKAQHVHEDACMKLVCAMPTGHTHTDSCNDKNRQSTVKLVTRKYQASLADIWPLTDANGVVYDQGQRWSPSNSSYYDAVLVYIATMPADDFTLTVNVSSYDTFHMHYMLEVLPGEAYTKTYNGKNFIESFTVSANYNYITREEDFFDIKGFQQFGSNPTFKSDQITQHGDVYFYYQRKTGGNVVLSFQNVNTVTQSFTGGNIMYGMPLAEYQYGTNGEPYIPPYPSTYEPNAYRFDQWFTTPECFPGTEVDWDALTMPDGALTLYAHYVPVKHEVNVYKDASLSEKLTETLKVDHGTFLTAPAQPTNGQLIFSGWFYKDDNGNEKAFVFEHIPVKDSLNIYAKWGSHVAVRYAIYYKYVDNNGNEIEIAAPTTGSTIAGYDRTFEAKGGTELFVDYQQGYFPLIPSHSVVMSAESANEYTFYYAKKDSIPYTVRYLDKDTGLPLQPEKVKVVEDNMYAVVTETFEPYTGYVPDEYQKRLTVSVNGSNELIFYYKKDITNAYYRVVHYWQNLDGTTYTEHSHHDIMAAIGTICAAGPIAINGFDFVEARIDGTPVSLDSDGDVRHVLPAEGMLIAFYYNRKAVSYTVDYVEYGNTSHQLVLPLTGTGLFGASVEITALDLTGKGYTLVSGAAQTITLKDGTNHVVFYYQENSVSYQYITMIGGTPSPSYSGSENTGAMTGNPLGFLPIVSQDYTFVGWFKDQDCTIPLDPEVDPVVIDASGRLIPLPTDANGDGTALYEGGVYYAKFDYNFTGITITVAGSASAEQGYLFLVEGASGLKITVAIIGNGTATINNLRVGYYRVSQLTDWSWRYNVQGEAVVSVDLSASVGSNVLTFTQVYTNDKWIDGNGHSQFLIP